MRAAVLVLVAGCDAALGLRTTVPADVGTQALACDQAENLLDEDGDGIANSHDVCPGIFDQLQDDTDMDGVGDACDRHPNTPGDRFVDAAYFQTGLGCWIPDAIANWTVAAGAVTTPLDGSGSMKLLKTASIPTIEVGFTFVTPTPGVNHIIEVRLESPNDPVYCRVTLDSTDIGSILLEPGGHVVSFQGAPLHMGSHRVVVWRDAGLTGCDLDGKVAMGPRAWAPAPTGVTIAVTQATVAFAYTILYDAPQ